MRTKEAMERRYSCKAYKPEQITERELNILLQAANAAPVGMGKHENVKLTVIQNRELLDRIDAEGARFFGNPQLHPLYGAPTMILVSVNADDVEVGMCNASCVIENMCIAAADLGLGACYIRGNIKAVRDDREICEAMKVPAGFVPAGAVIAGYPAAEESPRQLVTDKFAVEYVK